MEDGKTNISSHRKTGLIIMTVFLTSFFIYYSVLMVLSPIRKMAAIREEFGYKESDKKKVDERVFSDSSYLSLLKEKSFLQSRLIMAESDSIYLTISLPDSIVNIEISGVAVHKAKMNSVKASRIIRKGNQRLILSMLATPFTISNSMSTIKKEPVMIKTAPKDTSEFKPDVMPDTSLTEPVNYILEMTNGSRIFVCQIENEDRDDRLSNFVFDMKYRLNDIWRNLKDAVRFRVPEYHPYIKVKLPRDDAKIIYRAIPKYAQIGIFS